MVKNTTGGNKHKSQGRKFVNAKPSQRLRISEDEAEVYAQVTKMLGNGMCYVTTIDNRKLLCIIRGKFRGRGKRDNVIKNGSWILVGLREWEEIKEGDNKALNKCDLLEVYSDFDKDKLKTNVHINWKPFIENDCSISFTDAEQEDIFTFTNENQEEYKKLIEGQIASDGKKQVIQLNTIDEQTEHEDDDINIDDI